MWMVSFVYTLPLYHSLPDAGDFTPEIKLETTSLEEEEANLAGQEKAVFLKFMSKMLQWKPEDRKSAKELMNDPWLRY
jgi:serine/threonine-protein kinase SRPK3